MTETERRRLWHEAAAALNIATTGHTDWPDRLALSIIARIANPAAPRGVLSFLESDADAGRLPVEVHTHHIEQKRSRVATSAYLTRQPSRQGVTPSTWTTRTTRSAIAADVARVWGEMDAPLWLVAWLEPYMQQDTHEGAPAAPQGLTEMKRAAVIERLGGKYRALASALDRPEQWATACRVPNRRGWYYLERIEVECRARYGGAAPAPAVDLSPAGQLHSIAR